MSEKSQILDGLLVLRAQQGDKEALEQLVRKWHKKLLYQSFIRTKDWTQSEDIVQDVWQWAVSNLKKLKDAGKFGSWIRIVVDRRSIDWIRKQQRKRDQYKEVCISDGNNKIIDTGTSDYGDTPEDAHENQLKTLEQALNDLNSDSKMILVLYYRESNSVESIAKILGVPKGTVKSRLFHAREKLKNILKQKTYERSE